MSIKFFQKIDAANNERKSIEKLENGEKLKVLVTQNGGKAKELILPLANQNDIFTSSAWVGYRIWSGNKGVFTSGNQHVLLQNEKTKAVKDLEPNGDILYGGLKVDQLEKGNILCGQKWLHFEKQDIWNQVFVKVEGIWLMANEAEQGAEKNSGAKYIFPKNPFIRFIRKKMIAMNEKK
ncbi:MAG: hypothetical protein ACPGLV_05105 [Bacteroidia bacterium]